MTVRCGKCGEELLGAVNRCWRCGAPLVVRTGDNAAPPVRQEPVAVTVVPADQSSAARDADSGATETTDRPVRFGSPFAISADAPGHSAVTAGNRTGVQPRYPKNAAAIGGAIASVVLGILSLIVSLYTFLALPVSILGMLMGIWGLYSHRRGLAMVGLVLCCFALILSGFHGSVALFESIYGMKPWERPIPDIPAAGGF